MKSLSGSWRKYILGFMLLTAAILLGMSIEYSRSPLKKYISSYSPEAQLDTKLNYSQLDEIWRLLQDEYIDPSGLDPQKGIFGAIRGLVDSVGDPYSSFFDPEEAKLFLSDTEGSFEGIGAEIGVRKGLITVISPIHGTPAERSGLKAGDIIFQIDETSTANLNLDEAVARIRGEKGTAVKLLISRDDKEPFVLEIMRDEINIPALNLEMRGSIAYLQLFNFSQKSDQEFDKAAQEIINKKTEGIILDLRNNPGGYLDKAVDIAGWFLPRETIVVIEEDRNKKQTILRSEGNGRLKDIPLVILINEGSASASEILAGALSENSNITLVGKKSFGKGLVQSFKALPDNSAIKITVARWLTPEGHSITNEGIAPTIEIEQSEEDAKRGIDSQYEKAKEVLLNK